MGSIAKPPIPPDEAERLQVLRSYRILDTPAESAFDDLTRLAAQICGTPIALLTFVDADRMWVKSAQGMEVKEIERDHALCSHCIAVPELMEVADASRDRRFAENPIVASGPKLRFYAGAPLKSPDGHSIGALCVVDREPRKLTSGQREAIETLSRLAMKELELRRDRESSSPSRERLRLSDERFRSLIEKARDLIVILDEGGKFRYLSPAVTSVLGFSPEEGLGLDAFELIHPEDLGRVREAFGKLVAEPNRSQYTEFRIRHADGRYRFIETIGNNQLSNPEIRGLVVNARDLTERRKAEEELQSAQARLGFLLSSAPVVLYTARPDAPYGTTWISDTCRSILGDPAPAFLDRPRLRLDRLHPEDRPRILSELSLLASLGYQVLEYQYQKPEGGIRWIRDEVKLVRDPGGKPVEIVGCMVDISDQREAEAKLRRRERDRLHSNKMEAIGRLAGGVAHDFNNLLTAITGYSDLLSTKLEDGNPLLAHVTEIRKAGDRAASLCRQLLAFSRKQVLRPEILDLNDVIGNFGAMLRRVIGEDVELQTVLGKALLPVKVDRAQIEQVVLNLAANARDAMPRGGRLTIETRNEELDPEQVRGTAGLRAGPYVLLRVGDTGVGMDKDVLAHLFEPFFTTKVEGKGTGLGLSTVYGFVRQSGGHLDVASRPGEGTVFSIYLPHVPGEAPAASQIETTKIPIIRGTEHVLLVEDSDTVRNLARQILEFHGYTVTDAPDGEAALETFRRTRNAIDIVITDVVMPKMSGPDLVAKLAALKPSLKVLYMSGYPAEAVDSGRLVASGFSFISKPFTPEILAQKVRKVLGSGG